MQDAAARRRGAVRAWKAVRRRFAQQHGSTLTELIVVMAILGVVLTALTTLFVSGSRAELDQSNRFQAQQNARLALDKLRREIHCASEVTRNVTGTAIRIRLGSYCPTNNTPAVVPSYFTWCVKDANDTAPPVATATPFTLWRYEGDTPTCPASGARVKWADHVTTAGGAVFPLCSQNPSERATLRVNLLVDLTPQDTRQQYRLEDDIVLRNSSRTTGILPTC